MTAALLHVSLSLSVSRLWICFANWIMSYCVIVIVAVAVAGVPHPLAATVAVAIKMSAHASLPACNYSVLRTVVRTVVATEFICTQTQLKLNSTQLAAAPLIICTNSVC